MERHVLVVLAHPDDESFACGGTIALHSRAGTPVTYLCATRGEMGRRMGVPPFTNREQLRHLREQELRAACRALGIGDLRLLGLWDKTVEFADPEWLADQVQAVVAAVRPSLVITFHPLHGRHPDHNAMGAATVRALHRLPPAERPVLHFTGTRWAGVTLDLPLVTVDITPVAAAKRAAVAAHRSQSEGMQEQQERQYANDPPRLEMLRKRYQEEQFWVYDWAPIPGVTPVPAAGR